MLAACKWICDEDVSHSSVSEERFMQVWLLSHHVCTEREVCVILKRQYSSPRTQSWFHTRHDGDQEVLQLFNYHHPRNFAKLPLKFFFNCNIGYLQCYVNFCCTAKNSVIHTHRHIHTYIYICIHTHTHVHCGFFGHTAACGILVPWPGIELVLPAVEVQSLNHWHVREVLSILFKIFFSIIIYHRILNIIAPCAIQSDLVYPFYT